MKDYEKIYIDETLKENYRRIYEFLVSLDITLVRIPLSGEIAFEIRGTNNNGSDDLRYGVFYNNYRENSKPFYIWIQEYELKTKNPLFSLDLSGLENIEHKSYEKDFTKYYRYIGNFIVKLTEEIFKSNEISYSIMKEEDHNVDRTLIIKRVHKS